MSEMWLICFGTQNEVSTWGKYYGLWVWCLVPTETLYDLRPTTYTPPRTFSVGFEEEIVPGVMFFTFTDPKIVVKSLFPILYFLKKKQQTPYFHDSTP